MNKFKKILSDEKLFNSINHFNNITYSNNEIVIPEQCFSFDYIIEHNIFKKYENKIKKFMNIIFKSDLFNHLVRIIYKTENENMKYFFEEINFVEDFWNNNIIFVPFKIKKVSDFSYKDTSLFFFSIYKIRHFDSEIEDEIFTLGAFMRVLIHETFGHLVISYIFYKFYVNTDDYTNYRTPSMINQLKGLNRKKLNEFIGNFLAKIVIDNLNNEDKIESLNIKFEDSFKNKIYEEFKHIIGKEYAEKVIQQLVESQEIKIEKKNLESLSIKIIDILISLIQDEFNKYLNDLDFKQDEYKEIESGNFFEFLLFNNFDQYMNLKECLFILDEDNYKNTNFIKFRSEFKNLVGKKNDDFINDLNNNEKLFHDLFVKYISIYENKKGSRKDLIIRQNFRGDNRNNLNKKYEAFECHNIGRDLFISLKQSEQNLEN